MKSDMAETGISQIVVRTMSQRSLLCLLAGWSFLACQQYSHHSIPPEKTESSNIETVKPDETPIAMTLADIVGKSFLTGHPMHLTQVCDFHFECDCCAGELIFNPDFTFYSIQYCVEKEEVSKGTFRVENNLLMLNYSAIRVLRLYEEGEDVAQATPRMKDTLLLPETLTFSHHWCGKKHVLALKNAENEYLAIPSEKLSGEMMEFLEKEGFIERFRQVETQVSSAGPVPPKLTTISRIPAEIDGCSCYFAKNKYNFNNKKFIYLDTYYSGTAFISLNGQLIRINLDQPAENEYQVEIRFTYDEQNGDETWWKEGILEVTLPTGEVLQESFVGECGC